MEFLYGILNKKILLYYIYIYNIILLYIYIYMKQAPFAWNFQFTTFLKKKKFKSLNSKPYVS